MHLIICNLILNNVCLTTDCNVSKILIVLGPIHYVLEISDNNVCFLALNITVETSESYILKHDN